MSLAGPDVLGLLAQRPTQAPGPYPAYRAGMADENGMLHWLAEAAKTARVQAGRKQVHIAAEADKDQSSIYRFEQARGWPRDTDAFIDAYARDLAIEPIELWARALRLWANARDADAHDPPGELGNTLRADPPKPARHPRTGTRAEPATGTSGS